MRNINTFIVSTLLLATISVGTAVACYKPEPQITPIISPVPSEAVTPSEEVLPTLEVSTEPSAVPSVDISPSATPSADAPAHVNVSDGKSDGLHTAPDGLGCAAHECKATIPQGPPATGRG